MQDGELQIVSKNEKSIVSVRFERFGINLNSFIPETQYYLASPSDVSPITGIMKSKELAELTDSVPWKWWAKYQEFDKQNAKVEIVDLFHFLISLAQVMGMTAEDVYEAYLKKNKVNHNRQDSGYQKKDENDSRHI